MTRTRLLIASAAAATGLAAMSLAALTAPAAAAAADGEWRCIANGNIPIATLRVSGASYDIETSDGGTGTGDLSFDGGLIVPLSGPLADEFVVTGSIENSVLYWNNANGTLMACWPR